MLKLFAINEIPANSVLGYFFFAFIAMAGLAYINFLPGVMNALAGDMGFTSAEAGQIVALNGYGALLGSIGAVFLVHRFQWQRSIVTLFLLLSVVDMFSGRIDEYSLMLFWRFLAGVLGGLCVGIAFSVLARLNNPDRAFGLLLFVQFSMGSLVIYVLPTLDKLFGGHAVFYVMAGFVLLSLFLLVFLPALSLENQPARPLGSASQRFGDSALLMLAIFLYQCAASAIWAYVGLMGLAAGFPSEMVNSAIATTGLLGLLGAMLPMLSGKRYGRLHWVALGVVLSVLAALLLNNSHLTPVLYGLSMALLFFCWPAVQAFLLAVTAEMDSRGKLATVAAAATSLGLASGPLMASVLLDGESYWVMLCTCAILFLSSLLLLLKPVRSCDIQ